MKKVLPVLVLMGLFVVLLAPLASVSAIDTTTQLEKCKIKNQDRLTNLNLNCAPTGNDCYFTNTSNWDCGGCCLMQTVLNVSDWFFIVLVAVSAMFVLLGAFHLLMSGGSPDKIDTGRKYVIYAAVGLAVGFIAKAIPSLVKMMIGT